jgi:hypothetical protein
LHTDIVAGRQGDSVGNIDAFVVLQQLALIVLKMAAVAIPLLMLIGLVDRALNFMPWSMTYRVLGKPGLFVRTPSN